MTLQRHSSPQRKRQARMQRQVIILMILLVAILVMLVYFRSWLDELAGQGRDAAAPTPRLIQ